MGDSQPDFIALAAAARPEGPREALDRLWGALFSLPAWLFLMTPRSAETLQPSVQSIDGKAWMLVFTDSGLLRRYATENRNLDSKGDALYLSMDPDKALSYLSQYNEGELFGLRFNERAEHGWFSPLATLSRIHAHLKQNGLLRQP